MGKNIAIIDIESNGASTSYSNIISIAGILVSPELEELDRFEFWCRNKPGHVPDPYSMWVNRGFTRMKNSNMSHYSMMTELHKYINKWSPCLWTGWNSIGFDFVMLQKENYRSLFPIYITNQNGNEHSDFLPVARASKLFYPDCIKTDLSKKSNPVFRLDSIAPLNCPNLDKKKLHTAMGDCEVCLGVMRKLKKSANSIFENSMKTTAKIKAKDEIEKKGVRLALKRAEDADLNIVVIEPKSAHFAGFLNDLVSNKSIVVINKSDLNINNISNDLKKHNPIFISLKKEKNLSKLISLIKEKLKNQFINSEDILITRERHRQHLEQCVFHLESFKNKNKVEDFDKAAEDLRLATRHLGMIVGKVDVEEILGSIFNDFCIGK